MNKQTRLLVLLTIVAASLIAPAANAREAVLFQPSAKLSASSLSSYTSAGIKIGTYLGEGLYEASVEDGALSQVMQRLSAIDGNALIEPMPAGIKLKPLLQGESTLPGAIIDHNNQVAVTVVPAPGQDADSFTGLLKQLDPDAHRNLKVGGWSLRIDTAKLDQLAAEPSVASIRRAPAYPTLR